MKKVIIFGTTNFAQIAYFYLKNDSDFEVSAFTVNKSHISQENFEGLPVIEFESIVEKYPPQEYSMFVAIGYKKMNKIRSEICRQAKNKGYELISYVNSKATIWGTLDIGENCFIFEDVVIQPYVKIGNDVIMWSGNHIGHHSQIGDHCFITSHVVVSGSVKVGPYCFLGVNSTIRDGISIGSECLIGAGSLILHDTKDKEVYASEPTKPLETKSDQLNF